MMNKVMVMGRLTRDPELRSTQAGKSVCSFSIACNRNFKPQNGDKDVDFFNIVAWGNTAETVSRFFGKGRMIAIEGRLQTRDWQDKDGNKHTATEIVADNIFFCDSKPDNAGGGAQQGGGSYAAPAAGNNNYAPQQKANSGYGGYNGDANFGAPAGPQQQNSRGGYPQQTGYPQPQAGYGSFPPNNGFAEISDEDGDLPF